MRSMPIRTVNAGLLDFHAHLRQPVEVIMCMGDTLTHLPDVASIEALFDVVAATLDRGGVFVVTFRGSCESAGVGGDGTDFSRFQGALRGGTCRNGTGGCAAVSGARMSGCSGHP
jgi:hypothetical protein